MDLRQKVDQQCEELSYARAATRSTYAAFMAMSEKSKWFKGMTPEQIYHLFVNDILQNTHWNACRIVHRAEEIRKEKNWNPKIQRCLFHEGMSVSSVSQTLRSLFNDQLLCKRIETYAIHGGILCTMKSTEELANKIGNDYFRARDILDLIPEKEHQPMEVVQEEAPEQEHQPMEEDQQDEPEQDHQEPEQEHQPMEVVQEEPLEQEHQPMELVEEEQQEEPLEKKPRLMELAEENQQEEPLEKEPQPLEEEPEEELPPTEEEEDIVSCLCGIDYDDGKHMICCDVCDVWSHTFCYGITVVPDRFTCETCLKKAAQQ